MTIATLGMTIATLGMTIATLGDEEPTEKRLRITRIIWRRPFPAVSERG
jgi:hypothetical protein